jgi:hypothetical protein
MAVKIPFREPSQGRLSLYRRPEVMSAHAQAGARDLAYAGFDGRAGADQQFHARQAFIANRPHFHGRAVFQHDQIGMRRTSGEIHIGKPAINLQLSAIYLAIKSKELSQELRSRRRLIVSEINTFIYKNISNIQLY